MSFVTSLKAGQVVSNQELTREFECGNMGGMRRSTKTNTLVIVSDQTKGLYDDKWYGDTLHYTGMGKNGDQDLSFMQNKTLAESSHNNVDVHLFEVLQSGKYIYRGPVDLVSSPYQSVQKGADGFLRNVWIFPVQLRNNEVPISDEELQESYRRKSRQARKLSDQQLEQFAFEQQSKDVPRRNTNSTVHLRNPYVSEYAKRRANGICKLCRKAAPFLDLDETPYLETHHIEWLSRGGADDISNTVALCPNCHRRMHVLDLPEDKKELKQF